MGSMIGAGAYAHAAISQALVLLQAEGHIRAITVAGFPAASDDFTERAMALRPTRQR
jgi:histidine ammonia-lyase